MGKGKEQQSFHIFSGIYYWLQYSFSLFRIYSTLSDSSISLSLGFLHPHSRPKATNRRRYPDPEVEHFRPIAFLLAGKKKNKKRKTKGVRKWRPKFPVFGYVYIYRKNLIYLP